MIKMQGRREHTEDMKIQAKQTDIMDVVAYIGYTITKVGRHYSLKEHDSVVFYDTIEWLLDFSGKNDYAIHAERQKQQKTEQIPFVLPQPEQGAFKRIYAYLIKSRGIDKNVVDYFVKNKLLYESAQYHNLVFVGHDKHGIVRFASQRGTNDLLGKVFKCDVPGNDKNYGVNKVNTASDKLYVFESGIDMMSYMSLTGDFKSNKLALGMVADNPLIQFLQDHPHVREINFCLDMDRAGREATQTYLAKYRQLGYTVNDFSKLYFQQMNEIYGVFNTESEILYQPGKDFNELLQAVNRMQPVQGFRR